MKHRFLLVSLIALTGVQAGAAVIAGNWCNTANILDPPAGLLESVVWSNLTAPAPPDGNNFLAVDSASGLGGSAAGDGQDVLVYSDGTAAPAGLTISWAGTDLDTNDLVTRPVSPNTTGADVDDGHDQLMTGHLKVTDPDGPGAIPAGVLNITFSGMSAVLADAGGSHYNIYLYVDGDDESSGGGADWTMTDGATTYYGQDNATFAVVHTVPGSLADYARVTNTVGGPHQAGNYVLWSGLTADSVAFDTTTVNGTDIGIAGFEIQIVPIPEPASFLLFGVLGLVFMRRRV